MFEAETRHVLHDHLCLNKNSEQLRAAASQARLKESEGHF